MEIVSLLRKKHRPALVGYGTAAVAVALAVLARMAFAPFVEGRLLYATFFAAVATTAWLSGWRPALMSAVLGFLAAKWLFISPRYTLRFEDTEDVLVTSMYFIVSLVIIIVIHNVQRDRDRAVRQQCELEREIAERKKAEEALRHKEELLSQAQGIANLGSWEIDLTKNRISWSDEVYRIFGVQPKTFGGTFEEFLSSVHPEDRESVQAAYAKSLKNGSDTYDIEHRVVRKSTGEIRVVHEKCRHFRDEAGRVVRSLGMVHDITRRKRMEEELRKSEERARNLLRYAPAGICEIDLAGSKFISVNELMCNYLGYSEEELLRLNPFDLLTEKSRDISRERIRRRLAGKEGDDAVEYKIKAKDGREYDVALGATVTFNNGQPQSVLIIGHDITTRKRAEERLREGERRFRVMAETMPNLVWTATPDGRVDYRSRHALEYAGFPQRGSGGESQPTPVHPDDLPAMKRTWMEAVQNGDSYQAEFRVRRFDGVYRWHLSRGIPVRDDTGQIKKWVGTATDVHDLREARSELEKRVQERTAELAESEGQLRVLASELIKAQETERKRIAHELHDSLAAQLAAIKYRLERKLEGKSPEDPISLEEVIQDVRNAEIETRRIMANLRPSVLDDLGIVPALSWFCRETEKVYPGTSIGFSASVQEREVPEELKIVLFRVIQESVTNAIRHGAARAVRIALEKKDQWLRLIVEDEGEGFDAFAPREPSGSRGIGLDSMQQRVGSTTGIFSIRSTPGKGTRITAEWRLSEKTRLPLS